MGYYTDFYGRCVVSVGGIDIPSSQKYLISEKPEQLLKNAKLFQSENILDDLNVIESLALINLLSETRRMGRNVNPYFGTEGEWFIDFQALDVLGQEQRDNIIDYNEPPKTQPWLWLGMCFKYDPLLNKLFFYLKNGKNYYYPEWISYLKDNILDKHNIFLNGEIEWDGEDSEDKGTIIFKDLEFNSQRRN